MRLIYSLPVIASIGAVVAEVVRKGAPNDGADFASKSFDYVIIGGGTAGLAIAARLSETPHTTVGVIESGEYLPDDSLINTPASVFSIPRNAKYDWLFKSTPQVNANNRVFDLIRAKILGGCSAINVMVFDRGSKIEYDAWAKLGNPGWDWDGLLPSMQAAERFTGVDPFQINYTHADPNSIYPSQGMNGLVTASYNSESIVVYQGGLSCPNFEHPQPEFWKLYENQGTRMGYSRESGSLNRSIITTLILIYFNLSMANLGVPTNLDPDSGNALGTFNSATTVNRTTGRRSYAATTYYAYNAHRPNFVVLTGAQATKINFKRPRRNEKNGKLVATGVSFVHGLRTYTVQAKKEVILSAGALQSPHLLELSGIGNSTILEKNGIKPLIDLPGVGENYQDHVAVATTYELKPGSSIRNVDTLRNNATFAAAAAAQYNATHDGILSHSDSVISFINLDSLASSTQISSMEAQLNQEISLEKLTPLQKLTYDIQREWLKKEVGMVEVILKSNYEGPGAPKANASYMSLLTAFQHPFSRGNVHLNSSDPLAAPQIDPKFLSKSIDLEALVYSVKFSQRLSKTKPLASMIVSRQEPAPEVTSDAAIAEYVKANVASIHHSIGTASLAPKELGGVVDVHLKVYGTTNVRVVDASIIPLHIGSHTQRTIYGIAEKAAKLIKEGL